MSLKVLTQLSHFITMMFGIALGIVFGAAIGSNIYKEKSTRTGNNSKE